MLRYNLAQAASAAAVAQVQQVINVSQAAAYEWPRCQIAGELMKIPQVESVYVDYLPEMVSVWSVIDEDVDSVRDLIYKKESEIIRDLSPQKSFDFHVIARKGRILASLITLNVWNLTRL